jgi:CBS domain containing-hemolysin-like protein
LRSPKVFKGPRFGSLGDVSSPLHTALGACGLVLGGSCAALLGALRAESRAKLAQVVPDEAKRARLLALLEDGRSLVLAAIVLRACGFAVAAVEIAASVPGLTESARSFLEALLLVALALGLTDVVPRAVAEAAPERLIATFLPSFAVLARVVRPLVLVFQWSAVIALRIAGLRSRTDAEEVRDSLRSAALEGVNEGILDPMATHMIESALRFQDKEVRDVMTPRTEVMAVPSDAALDKVVKLLADSKYSRIPVYEGTLDRVVGVFYAKDVLAQELVEGGLKALMRKPVFVPETKKVSDLLREFRRGRPHLAVVVDEHGGTAGIVTLSDVIEEMLGDIRDEYDEPEAPRIKKEKDGSFEVAGAVKVDELEAALQVKLPLDPDYETVAGFVTTQLGRIPQKGETVRHDGLAFLIVDADERRVKRLRVQRV